MALQTESDSLRPRVWPRLPRQALLGAVILWVLPMVVIGVMVASNPLKRTVTPLYHEAAAHWWAGQSLYAGPQGMNYFPVFALVFSPFHLLPLALADILWRWCAAALLAVGLSRLLRAQFGREWPRPFFWATLLALPLCLDALRNGQANAIFGGLTLLAVASLAETRWWQAALFIVLALAIKPLGLVLLLLAPVCYAPLRWRLALALGALILLPFLAGQPEYVIAQHREALANLKACAAVTEHRFADINGILRTFGTPLPDGVSRFVRVGAGGLTLGLWALGFKRFGEPSRVLWLYALTTAYLMLFNPMNEANSYVILAPALAVWAAALLSGPFREQGAPFGWVIVAMALTMGLLPTVLRSLFGNYFALFWHPLMTLGFLATVGWCLWRIPLLVPPACPWPAPASYDQRNLPAPRA